MSLLLGQDNNSTDLVKIQSNLPWIAQAGCAYKNRIYLNCLECFEQNYRKGFRLFEFDLMMARDGYLAAIHNGQEKDFGLPLPPVKFTLEKYKQSSFCETRRIPESDFVRLMKEYKEWSLITNIKDDNMKALKKIRDTFEKENINWIERVVPQFYRPEEIGPTKALGFRNIIFTLYRFGNKKKEVHEAIMKNKIWAVTLWASWWDNEWREIIESRGAIGFVHTVNDPLVAEKLFKEGVKGIYTDFLDRNINLGQTKVHQNSTSTLPISHPTCK